MLYSGSIISPVTGGDVLYSDYDSSNNRITIFIQATSTSISIGGSGSVRGQAVFYKKA